MSIRSVTRTVVDPAQSTSLTFINQDPNWARWYPNDQQRTILCPLAQTVRLFEAYTPNSSKDHTTPKPFEHYKAETTHAHGLQRGGLLVSKYVFSVNGMYATSLAFDDRLFNNVGTLPFGSPGLFDSGLTSWYVPRSDGGFIPLPTDLESLKAASCKAMMPRIKAELSSLVSLYEIRDIVSIRGTLRNLAKTAGLLLRLCAGAKASLPIAKVVTRSAADGYLQWMFNLKPLLSDMGGIYHSLKVYERRINDLVNRSAKVQTRRFRCVLNEQMIPVKTTWTSWKPTYFASETSVRFQRTSTVTSAVFNASMQYNYYYSAFQREHAKVLGLLDMLGVNFNPAYLWNVIPWSFVVDWVLGVSRWLSQFEVKNLEPKINVMSYCWSVRKQRIISVAGEVRALRYYGGSSAYPIQFISLPEVRETSYRRGTDLPSASSFTTSGLSSTELSLGAALIITRRRRNTGGSTRP